MPAGKPESVRGVGSLGSGARSTGGRGRSTPSSFGKNAKRAMETGEMYIPNKVYGRMTKAETGKKLSTNRNSTKPERKASSSLNGPGGKAGMSRFYAGKSRTVSPKTTTSQRIVKPSAAGKKAAAKYSGKMKNTPKG